MVKIVSEDFDPNGAAPKKKQSIFPSTRFFMATLLCMCFISLAVATSNLGVSMVCMVRDRNFTIDTSELAEANDTSVPPCKRKRREDDDVTKLPCNQRNRLEWTSFEQGCVFAAQNVGSLMMLISGPQSDKLNGKWTICVALTLIILSNAMIPLVASTSVWLVFVFRVVTGMGDAFLFPSASSMITRWFPPKERPFAIGYVTGGRQIGALLITPIAGVICDSSGTFGGWTAVFYLSAMIGSVILIVWLFLAADKPSKHFCVSQNEQEYITRKIEEESLGKRTERGSPPWKKLLKCRALYVAVFALVCHEFPLVILIQLLPKYLKEVLGVSNTSNGVLTALPMAVLWVSKTLSSSASSLLTARKPPILSKTTSCRMFNFIASLGLGVCIGVAPFVKSVALSMVILCLANAFAGLHTPGVQTALVQIAPAYSGIITGIAFSIVAFFSILNKIVSSVILGGSNSATHQWTIVFEISAVVALLPVFFFTIWGSADLEPWASPSTEKKKDADQQSQSSQDTTSTQVSASSTQLAKYEMYLDHASP